MEAATDAMRMTHLRLENWRNFRHLDIHLPWRAFIVGPNASGKSNLLDALRFLHDLAEPEGGFQRAVKARGGVSQVRCLHARQQPDVAIEVGIMRDRSHWAYRLAFAQDEQRQPLVKAEQVWHNGEAVLSRPDSDDRMDSSRLTQTHLEQVNANRTFREVAACLAEIRYLHIVPQLIRESDRTLVRRNDPFGSDFLEQMAAVPSEMLEHRLRQINEALRYAVPQLRELRLERDGGGVLHLRGLCEHWRPNAGWQTEAHFSDGTLRLLGLLWSVLDGDGPLLLEEPELSLHGAVVRRVPAMMVGIRQKAPRQVFVSTHAADLLADEDIAPEEVMVLEPLRDGTRTYLAAQDRQIRALLENGVPIAEAVLSRTAPEQAVQLSLFGGQ